MAGKGNQLAPLEINVEGVKYQQWEIQFRLVFPASMSENDVDKAIRLLGQNGEAILQHSVSIEEVAFFPRSYQGTRKWISYTTITRKNGKLLGKLLTRK